MPTADEPRAAAEKIAALDWSGIRRTLQSDGWAPIAPLLSASECASLVAMYDVRERFRSRIEMARFRFGLGEYKYFAAPLPPLVASLRSGLYSRVAPIANEWMAAMGTGIEFSPTLEGFLQRCHQQGQSKPTPLILSYQTGGYNCMHQDLYGELAFPLQFTFMLSRRGADYEGGEFLLLEQRPRAQSRCEALSLEQGAGVLFATRHRPVAGARGVYRVNVRHGVSTVRRGRRFTLGIIFHDAQ